MPQRFPGQYADKETNLAYNMARDYANELGRYISSDPIGLAGGINTYAYVANAPLRKADPTGLFFDLFAQAGVQGGVHVLAAGLNITCGFVGSVGASCQVCRFCTICVRLGPGLFIGGGLGFGGGVAGGDLSNFAGDSFGLGGDLGAGLATFGGSAAVGVSGNVFTGPMGTPVSAAAFRGRWGGGYGISGGIEMCRTKILVCDGRLWGKSVQ